MTIARPRRNAGQRTPHASPGAAEMSLVAHLTELRYRLVICAIAVTVGGAVAFFFYDAILEALIAPYERVTGKSTLYVTDPLEGFGTRLKVAGYAGFALGAGIAFATLPQALGFLVGIGGDNLETLFSPSKYLGLVTLMMIAFGLAFELPLLLVFLQLAGVLESAQLRRGRRWAVVLIFVFVAVITPSGDPYSLFALALPMYLFYEGAALAGRLLGK